MSLVINNNIMAINTERKLSKAYDNLSNSIRRMSSGLRIERAGDDAAGLAIREQMRSNITALNQGVRNAQDGISLIQTAESNLSVIDEKLIRMKELAEQAATGTYTNEQRLIIHSEFMAVGAEIDRIATRTNFNGIKLLDGNVSISGTGAGATNNGGWTDNNTWAVGTSGLWTNSSGWQEVSGTAQASGEYNAGVSIHFGPKFRRSEDYYFIRIGDMRTASLFRGTGTNPASQTSAADTIAVSTQIAAQRALEQIDTAIARKDNMRAALGAIQNRLEATVDNLQIEVENLSASESRISDIDIAKEMTEFVRNQVLQQSAVGMLAQANSLPQVALQIMG